MRRPLPGLVAVKQQDRLRGQFPHQLDLVGGQGRAQRRDSLADPRRDHGDDIDIAFHRNHTAALMRRLAGRMAIVKLAALVEQLGLR